MDQREFVPTVAAGATVAPRSADAAADGNAPGRLRAGAAKVDITPAAGVPFNAVILRLGNVEKVHDPLHARCLVLDDGRTQVAIAIVDVTMAVAEVFDRAKLLAHERTGIPAEHMLMAGTHTHAASRMMGSPETDADRAYYEQVAQGIAEAIETAAGNLAPAAVGWGSVDVPQFVQNRRWLVEPGKMPPNPFGETTDQVMMYGNRKGLGTKPSGPVDPELSLVSVRHADGRPLAVLANYSLHYVGGYEPRTVTADYFGYFARGIEACLAGGEADPGVVGIMSNGASGDTGGMGGGYEKMAEVAEVLATEAAKLCEAMDYHGAAPLAMCQSELEVGIRHPDEARLGWAKTTADRPKKETDHPWRDVYVGEILALSQYPSTVALPIQAIRLGDLGIAAVPNEVFADTGLAIKRESPLKPTITIELANDYRGYLPTPEQHRLGGYETWPARSSCLEVEAEPKIRVKVLEALREVAGAGEP